ncbi:MAG: cytochrome c3 family protein, partial [Ignavibacteriae bacterium]|nr:cytochrome c3 family protein [Ignavibacteriota bacterium]
MKNTFRFYFALVVVLVIGLYSCTELKTDLPTPVSAGFTVHKTEWMDTTQANFHGKFLKAKNWAMADCEPCHSKSYEGGTSEVACFSCHSSFPHRENWTTTIHPNFHGAFLQTNNWGLGQCQSCHGEQYAGEKRVEVSCMTAGCHVDNNGNQKSPEACNTCHGDFRASADDTVSWAPPRSVSGDTLRTNPSVGAHRQHLETDSLGKAVKCQ